MAYVRYRNGEGWNFQSLEQFLFKLMCNFAEESCLVQSHSIALRNLLTFCEGCSESISVLEDVPLGLKNTKKPVKSISVYLVSSQKKLVIILVINNARYWRLISPRISAKLVSDNQFY